MSLRLRLAALMAIGLAIPALAGAQPCEVVDNGSGTVDLPPPGCGYLSPADFHLLANGLPPGTTINIGTEHQKFFNVTHTPGGPLGGEVEHFQSILRMDMNGTGGLGGFHRMKTMQANCETHTGPRLSGNPVQQFNTDMFMIQGQLPAGDPDFDLLRITAGTGFGMPSPGHTTLIRLANGNWNVDSFFDIEYRIDFIGHPGGPLGGMSGSTTGTIRMGAGVPGTPPPCTVVDNGSGTANLPPAGCDYVSPEDLHMMINGLPPGTVINVAAEHGRFFNVQHTPGGPLGGEIEQYGSGLTLNMQGTGDLAGFNRLINMQPQCQTFTGPRQPGQPMQSFNTQMNAIQGQITGDPDFDLLRVTAGNAFGMPSPGHTTLTRQPNGMWNVDSFFDIEYRIDFIGAPGGPLGGHSGSTTGTIRMATGGQATTGIPSESAPARRTELLVSRPNPFNPSTEIHFVLESAGQAGLTVYDGNGRMVRHLANERFEAGEHGVTWDGRNDAGGEMASGSYFFQLTVNGQLVGTQKAVILK